MLTRQTARDDLIIVGMRYYSEAEYLRRIGWIPTSAKMQVASVAVVIPWTQSECDNFNRAPVSWPPNDSIGVVFRPV